MLRLIFYYRRRKVLRLYFCVFEENNRLSFFCLYSGVAEGLVILENLVILVDQDNLVVLGILVNLGIVLQITQIFTNL